MDYKKFKKEELEAYGALKRQIKDDNFFQQWLKTADESNRWLKAEQPTPDELQQYAENEGYRTARSWLEMRKDGYLALNYFINEDAFKKLWMLLKEYDQKTDWHSYSPANGGVPSRLMSALQLWHQSPKFTVAERIRHSKKVALLCQELEELLSQVFPSHLHDDQYDRFRFSNQDQAKAMFASFGSASPDHEARGFFSISWFASHRLKAAGVVPMWAVQNIKQLAQIESTRSGALPTKVRAKTAKRTYLIGAVSAAICKGTMSATLEELAIGPQLIADLVALLSNMDCSADDVRKAF